MRALIMFAAGALVLAGCRVVESQDDAGAANAAAPAEIALENAMPAPEAVTDPAPATPAPALRPGEWETSVEMIEAEMPGMPKMGAEAVARAQGTAKTHRYCMTPADAGQPTGAWLSGNADQKCRYTQFSMAGGRIESVLSCPGPDGREAMTVTTTGTVTPELVNAEARMAMSGANGMKVTTRVTSRRIGECPAAPQGEAK